jgi:hypothetical protein
LRPHGGARLCRALINYLYFYHSHAFAASKPNEGGSLRSISSLIPLLCVFAPLRLLAAP